MRNEGNILGIARIAANVGAALLCVTLSAAVAKRVFWPPHPQAPANQVRVGDRISIPGVKLGPGDTIVLALRDGCPYCKASAPLYKELLQAAGSAGGRVIAALPEGVDRGRSYLRSLGLEINEVYDVPLDELHVAGTPTLLVLNEGGVVRRALYGQQPTEQNVRIVHDIFGGS
jgi:thiol-disulfide isomerase/thioredoxin